VLPPLFHVLQIYKGQTSAVWLVYTKAQKFLATQLQQECFFLSFKTGLAGCNCIMFCTITHVIQLKTSVEQVRGVCASCELVLLSLTEHSILNQFCTGPMLQFALLLPKSFMEVYNLTQDITEKQHHLFYKKRERHDHLLTISKDV
jgi:hypothetical protein